MQTLDKQPLIRAPFPWFGGKALAAEIIWERFGSDIKNYIEPFFGSGAVLLNAPKDLSFASTVNDFDGYVCNFWRAIDRDPDEVARYANSQVNEVDLQSRHQWLVNNSISLTEKLKADPGYYCARSAGWWAWGCCCWIAGGWCAPKEKVGRKMPQIGASGRGVLRKIPQPDQENTPCEDRHIFLSEWFHRLNGKFYDTKITCGDWQRICTAKTMVRFGVCAVVLDPPYGTTGAVYAHDSTTVADEVRDWCIKNGSNPKLRIALCGHAGQHEILESMGWDVITWKKGGCYQGADDRERIWFSPGCVDSKTDLFLRK